MTSKRMTSKKEKFFRQRVLNKLFPCDEESQSDSEDNETQRNLEKESTTRTEDEALYEVPYKGQKRKRSENDDGTFSQRIDVSLEGEQSTSPFPSQIEAAEKRVSVCTPTSVSDEPAQSTQRKRLDYPRVQTEREEKSPRGTGSQCTESTDQVSKLSKNQKRKMKKKRHKERIRSGGVKQTKPGPNEFTYETS